MCPYMIMRDGDLPKCEPKNNICTMCVAGNMKIFKEIKNEANKNGDRAKRQAIWLSMS